jgi:hypothetical protein
MKWAAGVLVAFTESRWLASGGLSALIRAKSDQS